MSVTTSARTGQAVGTQIKLFQPTYKAQFGRNASCTTQRRQQDERRSIEHTMRILMRRTERQVSKCEPQSLFDCNSACVRFSSRPTSVGMRPGHKCTHKSTHGRATTARPSMCTFISLCDSNCCRSSHTWHGRTSKLVIRQGEVRERCKQSNFGWDAAYHTNTIYIRNSVTKTSRSSGTPGPCRELSRKPSTRNTLRLPTSVGMLPATQQEATSKV